MDSSMESVFLRARAARREGFLPPLDEVHGAYRIRFARTEEDLDRIFRLRFEVFNVELGEGLEASFATERDTDPFDAQCHHVMVIRESTGQVVGTYRLQVREMAEAGEGFYSATEFDMRSIPDEMLADCIEAGRACIAADERNKTVLYLLWRGLAAYVLWNGRRYFFGCASLTSQDPDEGLRAFDQLTADGHAHPELCLAPLPGYECMPGGDGPTAQPPERVHIPTLFRTYLRYGAKICGPPTIDRYFGTIDFLVCLDVGALPVATFGMFARGLPGLDS